MKQLTLSKRDLAESVIDLMETLKSISILYGFKLPNESDIVKEISKDIITEFGSLTIDEIKTAFRMAVKGSLNVDITSFGQILTITMLDKVLRAYRSKRNIHRKKEIEANDRKRLKAPGDDIRNINARLTCLYEFRNIETKITVLHYNVIDQYIEQFQPGLKIDAYERAKTQERQRITSKIPIDDKGRFEIQNQMGNIDESSKVVAKIILANEWLEFNRENINYIEVRSKIINNKK